MNALLLTFALTAQIQSDLREQGISAAIDAAIADARMTVQAQSDQDTTIDHLLMGGLMGLQAADGIISAYGFGAGTHNEANPILRPLQDKPILFALAKVGVYSGVSLLLYLLHKKSPKPVRYTLIGLMTVQTYVVVRHWQESR